MALTKPIQDVFEGNPVSGTYKPVASEVTTLMNDLVVNGNNPEVRAVLLSAGTGGIGHTAGVGAGGSVTQLTSRTTAVTLNTRCGRITMFSAAGSATWQRFTVNNSVVGLYDTIHLTVKVGGANMYMVFAQKPIVGGVFDVLFATTGGTAVDAPFVEFEVINGTIT